MMNNEELLSRVDRFFTDITPDDKVCIIHDSDSDGISSAVIIAKAIQRLRNKPIDLHTPLDRKTKGITQENIKQIHNKKITHLITCDFSPDQDPETIKQLEQKTSILVVDHHKVYHDISSEKTILYKPQFFTDIDPPQYCTAKLALDAAARVIDVEDLEWLAAAASIADIATAPWKGWLLHVFKKYNDKPKKDLFQTKLGEIASIVSSTEVYDENLVPKLFKAFSKASTPEDILNSSFGKYKKIIDKELNKHIIAFKTKAEKHGKLSIYELTSKYRINSPLSTILGLKYSDRIIILINTGLPFIKVSARNNSKNPPVNNLLEQAIIGFDDANAGGHAPSAGAGFPKRYLKQFKQRIIELASSL
ncbi:hypothetical protein HY489_02380 [Candidatus Woesearchaeota archaeon]|nr:hypothetical protein [Candidatus Woesearchaeota archaeon]